MQKKKITLLLILIVASCFSAFSQGFGNGSNGRLTVSSTQIINNYYIADSIQSNSFWLNPSTPFFTNQKLLFVIMSGPQNGYYQWVDVTGKTGNKVMITAISNYFTDINNHTQIISVPQHDTILIKPTGVLTCQKWNGSTGGVLALMANSILIIDSGGKCDVSGMGFQADSVYTNQAGGVGGSGGVGGNAGVLGQDGSSNPILFTGIGGGGNGGFNGNNGTSINAVSCNNCGGQNSSYPLSYINMGNAGTGGKGGNGGRGGGGGGGGSNSTGSGATNGQNGGIGGNGGKGGKGGNGGGIILFRVQSILIPTNGIQFFLNGTDAALGNNGIPGGKGGNGGLGGYMCLNGGGGGGGANGGNGGDGGSGGAGGAIYGQVNVTNSLFTANHISVKGGKGKNGGIGGSGGVAGINGGIVSGFLCSSANGGTGSSASAFPYYCDFVAALSLIDSIALNGNAQLSNGGNLYYNQQDTVWVTKLDSFTVIIKAYHDSAFYITTIIDSSHNCNPINSVHAIFTGNSVSYDSTHVLHGLCNTYRYDFYSFCSLNDTLGNIRIIPPDGAKGTNGGAGADGGDGAVAIGGGNGVDCSNYPIYASYSDVYYDACPENRIDYYLNLINSLYNQSPYYAHIDHYTSNQINQNEKIVTYYLVNNVGCTYKVYLYLTKATLSFGYISDIDSACNKSLKIIYGYGVNCTQQLIQQYPAKILLFDSLNNLIDSSSNGQLNTLNLAQGKYTFYIYPYDLQPTLTGQIYMPATIAPIINPMVINPTCAAYNQGQIEININTVAGHTRSVLWWGSTLSNPFSANQYNLMPLSYTVSLYDSYYDTILNDTVTCHIDTTFDLTAYIDTVAIYIYDTICANGVYYIDGWPYSAGSYTFDYYHADACDTIFHYEIYGLPVDDTYIDTTICDGEYVDVGNNWYNTSGNYIEYLQNQYGCDSTILLNLNVEPLINDIFSATTCETQPYYFDGNWINSSGTYVRNYLSANGCPNTETLFLTVFPENSVFEIHDTICAGADNYHFGTNYNTEGVFFESIATPDICDSVFQISVVYYPIQSSVVADTLCDGATYWYNGVAYNTTGQYAITLQSQYGCDSIVTLDIFFMPLPIDTIHNAICSSDSVLFNGNYYNQSGIYTAVYQNRFGCDSTVILDLVVQNLIYKSIWDTICFGTQYHIGDSLFSNTGQYTVVIHSASSCDSVYRLNLYVRDSVNPTIIDTTICKGNSITIGNQQYSDAGNYIISQTTINGCDSNIILKLNVIQPTYILVEHSGCKEVVLYNNAYQSDTILTNIILAENGCDSIVTIDTIHIFNTTASILVLSDSFPVLKNSIVKLQITPLINYATIHWRDMNATIFSDSTSVEYTAMEDAWIYLEAIDSNGCNIQDSIFIPTINFTYRMPTAFSPNGDGKNEVFYPVMNKPITPTRFAIYNRWNELVYSYKNDTGWDGKYNGSNQPDGVYYYIIEINGEVKRGVVTVIR